MHNLKFKWFHLSRIILGEDTRAIADELLKVHTVVLNLEDTNKDVSRRILTFCRRCI